MNRVHTAKVQRWLSATTLLALVVAALDFACVAAALVPGVRRDVVVAVGAALLALHGFAFALIAFRAATVNDGGTD